MSATAIPNNEVLSLQAQTPPVLNKANETLVLALRKGRLTVTARKLYNVLLHSSQQELFAAEKAGKPIVDPTHLFRASLSDLVEYIKRDIESPVEDADGADEGEEAVVVRGSKSDPRSAVKSYFMEMMSTVVEWQEPAGAVKWKAMPILAMAQEEQEKGKAVMFAWRHQAEVFQTLARKSGYTPINIESVTKLETYEAIALYEICARYRGFVYQTTKHEPDWWQKALSRAANRKLRDWRLFKNQKLKPAIEQINRLTDLDIELVEEREGGKPRGKLLSVQFLVRRKGSAEASAGLSPRFPEELLKKAADLGVPTTFLINSSTAGTSNDALAMALDKLAVRVAKKDLPPVDAPVAYLRKVLEELAGVTDVEAKPAAPAAKTPEPTTNPAEPKSKRREEVIAALEAMPADELDAFCEAVFDSFSPHVQKAFGRHRIAKNWRFDAIWAHAQKAKGDEMFGPGWEQTEGAAS